ncbi:hypothetical protein IFM61392_07128 [Aspergillus lentulus]|nr:hypothetical protein CNMCM8060_005894 [Aspergillus lentulus]KAF4186839.1 hypothetical protein CNMCM7927_005079 [Aspergillus lentulus]KAF4196997.1 hypothetical protein CNMCM8694_004017 [Aspergillus lentulus]GFF64784.1 hypothetical protein IFM62136_06073 [Aspergillus lentulus]GFF87280.1 hypothetical protein IFM47457_07441 [Aspergillus lentulus]
MSDETPVTPPSTALYPVLVTPPESGNSIENPILISDSDGSDASDTEALRGSVRQLSDNSPSPSPRRADRLQPQKLRRHSRYVTPSRGDANVEQLDEVENTRESDINISDQADDTPHRLPELPVDGPNGGTPPESCGTGRSLESIPSASVGPMPIWMLETKIKEVILKAEGQGEGYAYLFADPSDEAGYFKLGKSETPLERGRKHQSTCDHPTFAVIDMLPRGQPVPWYGRLESLALAELANVKYSFDCFCGTPHKEYFTGRVEEALEILNCWSSWLEGNPYDEDLQLLPFWRDRLRLLGGKAFSHPRCPSIECRSARDIGSSSCQACLRLRLKAWTDVTDFDYFEYECRMKIGWGFLRQVISLMWLLFGNSTFILIDGCVRTKHLTAFLWAPTTHLHLLLVLMLQLWLSSNAPRESIVYYAIPCFLAYCRITSELDDTLKVQTIPQSPRKKATRRASNSPGRKILSEVVSETETPDEQQPPSKRRSVSIHGSDDISNTPRGQQSAPSLPGMSEIPNHNGPKPFLTPDRAKRTVGKSSPKAGTKRRKSDVH